MKLIAPSFLSADFGILKEEIKQTEKSGADIAHIDVMDGHFVPPISFGDIVVKVVKKHSTLPIDVHLMVENPDKHIETFAKAGADYISVHYETLPHLNRTINLIKSFGIKAGVAINPATDIANLEYILEYIDFVLIMSVNPGFGGQKFIPNSLRKIKRLKEMIKEKNLNVQIEVDGGINEETIEDISKAGCDMFVVGSAFFKNSDYKKTIISLKEKM